MSRCIINEEVSKAYVRIKTGKGTVGDEILVRKYFEAVIICKDRNVDIQRLKDSKNHEEYNKDFPQNRHLSYNDFYVLSEVYCDFKTYSGDADDAYREPYIEGRYTGD